MRVAQHKQQTLYCELCGAPIQGQAYRIVVDGVEMIVCYNCYRRYLERIRSLPKPAPSPKTEALYRTPSTKSPSSTPSRGAARAGPTSTHRLVEHKRILSQPKRRGVSERQAMAYEVVSDYAERVRKARERLGWSQKMLAERVRESENVIRRIELGKLKPTIDLARRLERVLGIKLLEPVVEEPETSDRERGGFHLTLGDIAEIRED
ncbi:MAG: multiprotein bridging factor aMBF1 [Pyrodictiaceae archaeon]